MISFVAGFGAGIFVTVIIGGGIGFLAWELNKRF